MTGKTFHVQKIKRPVLFERYQLLVGKDNLGQLELYADSRHLTMISYELVRRLSYLRSIGVSRG